MYGCLQSVEKTDKSYVLAIDAGQSMQYGGVLGCETITPLMASAAVAMMFVWSEPNYQVVGMASELETLDIRSTSPLADICMAVSRVCSSWEVKCLSSSKCLFLHFNCIIYSLQ